MPHPVLRKAIDRLAQREDLGVQEAEEVLRTVMAGEASDIEISAFLIALRTKGETADELAGLAQAMRSLAARVETGRDDLLDTAGTGGGRPTFNVSTTAALIAAGAGLRGGQARQPQRHRLSGLGRRARGARRPARRAAGARRALHREAGFGFMFAPAHHGATRYVVPVRKELAVRTIFNFLGPLTNPAGATRQLIGVSDPRCWTSWPRHSAGLAPCGRW
jgi:anthranilate phosphoribosyltransferase